MLAQGDSTYALAVSDDQGRQVILSLDHEGAGALLTAAALMVVHLTV